MAPTCPHRFSLGLCQEPGTDGRGEVRACRPPFWTLVPRAAVHSELLKSEPKASEFTAAGEEGLVNHTALRRGWSRRDRGAQNESQDPTQLHVLVQGSNPCC